MKKILLSLLLATACLSNVHAQTFKFEQYDLENFSGFLDSIKPNHRYYFDLDNTLIAINDYKYGSDGWTDVIASEIKGNSIKYPQGFDYLYNQITPSNFNALQAKAVKSSFRDILNKHIELGISVNGLTSRSSDVESQTLAHLTQANYKKLETHYTAGGNKGEKIYLLYKYEVNKTKQITYVDDTYEKLLKAYNSLQKLFEGEKDVVITLVHLQNTDAKNYEKCDSCDFTKNKLNDSIKKLCDGMNNYSDEQRRVYIDAFNTHYNDIIKKYYTPFKINEYNFIETHKNY